MNQWGCQARHCQRSSTLIALTTTPGGAYAVASAGHRRSHPAIQQPRWHNLALALTGVNPRRLISRVQRGEPLDGILALQDSWLTSREAVHGTLSRSFTL
jgi:hypothetical protein